MALQFLVFCSTFLFFGFALLQGIYQSLYECMEWIVHFFPVKSAKVKSMIAGLVLLCCTACISISMWIIDVPNIYQYLVRYGVVVSSVKTVNFLYNIVTIFKVITFLEVTAAAFSLCSQIFASALSIEDPIYHGGEIKEYGKHEKK